MPIWLLNYAYGARKFQVVINAYTGHIVKSPYDMFFRPAHASVSIVLAGQGRRVVRLLNDTHHLSTAEGDVATY